MSTKRIGIVLSMVAVASVLAFGGVETFGFAPVQAAIVLLAGIEFWRRGWPSVGGLTRFLLMVLLIVPLLQRLPLPSSIIASLSPSRARLDHDIFDSLDLLVPNYMISMNPYETQMALLRLICYLLVFLLAIRSYRLRGGQAGLVATLVGLGVFEAAYGLVQYLTGWQYIFTYAKRAYLSEATGTYINRNHFAGLLEMVLPFLLGGILLRIPSHRLDAPRSRWVQVIVSPWTSPLLRDIIVFALVALALVFSRSRMGIASALVGMLVVAVISFLYARRGMILVVVLLVLAVPAAYSAWVGLEPVVTRFEGGGATELLGQDRLPLWRDTNTLIWDHPWLGSGLGTYRWVNLHYQSHMLDWQFEHAHNDYLEFAADLGLPTTVLLFGGLWILAARVARRAPQLEHSHDRILAAGCAGALISILAHETVDFNLQIPANALLFSWIAGTAAALIQETPNREKRSRS